MKDINLWLDLDENLCCSRTIYDEKSLDENMNEFPYEKYDFCVTNGHAYNRSSERIISHLRPHAQEFVKKCEELFGVNNVKILTQSSASYADMVCSHYFDIGWGRVIDRNKIKMQKFIYEDEHNALVDNLPTSEQNTIDKLKYLGGDVHFIQSSEFDIRSDFGYDHSSEFNRIYSELVGWRKFIIENMA